MSIVPNQISEIHPGVFYSVLDFPVIDILDDLLDDSYGYVLILSHGYGDYTWRPHKMSLMANQEDGWNIWTRMVTLDFVITLHDFKKLRKSLAAGHFIQIKGVPPDFFDSKKIQGAGFYSMLEKIGWNFELIIPSNDYAQIMSPSRDVIEKAISL
jgi:hypothetical protein